jgi:putative transposase
MITSFPKIVNSILYKLDKNDYPVLNTRLFVECWLGFTLDKNLTSMRDLFFRLNCQDKKVDISTFSKASKSRSLQPFLEIYEKLSQQFQKSHKGNEIPIVPN